MEIKAKEITLFPSVKLSEYPKNVNVHTEEQIDKIIQLIDFYGHRDPLIVDADLQPDGTHWVMAGNGRLSAAKKAGWDNLPIIFQKFNSEEEKYGFMVSHNAVSSSGWGGGLDLAKINTDIIDLGPDFDIEMLAIKDFVIEPIEKFEPQADEDEVPEVVHPITRKGDLWILGSHRLLCGDSTMIDDVERLMNGEKADMVFTDPPFPNNSGIMHEMIENIDTAFVNSRLFCDGMSIWFWDNIGFPPFNENVTSKHIWHKTNGWQAGHFETMYVFHNDGKRHEQLVFNANSVGGNNKREDQGNHPTPKPVELPVLIFEKLKFGNCVLDLFTGSGSTLIACEKTSRKCYGMELDEKYCDVIVKRWEQYTGKKAVLESTNQTYEELKLERGE